MALDIGRIVRELQSAPIESPYPLELASAVVADCFRHAARVPVADASWKEWAARKDWPRFAEQLGMLAHLLATTSLREETVAAMRTEPSADRAASTEALLGFFTAVEPITAEMVRSNAFRREELVRRWIAAWSGAIEGETPEQSAGRLEQLDYRKTLAEYGKAEEARKAEAERREQLLREEAAKKEAEARQWRE